MAYSKAKLKSNGDRASPCFKPFLIGNISDKFLPTRTLLYVSIRHIFISLTSFLGIPNSMRILYKVVYTFNIKKLFLMVNKFSIFYGILVSNIIFTRPYQPERILSMYDIINANFLEGSFHFERKATFVT